jgi:stage V sporulation protein D (sporulation-specific penicillin-binding protein)
MALGVEPRKDQIEKELRWPDVPPITLPDLTGLTKLEITEQLLNLKIDASGEGDIVVRQSPEAGTKVKEGSTIRLFFDKEE